MERFFEDADYPDDIPPLFHIEAGRRRSAAPDCGRLAIQAAMKMLGVPSAYALAKMLGVPYPHVTPYMWLSGAKHMSGPYQDRLIFALFQRFNEIMELNPDLKMPEYWTGDRLVRELPRCWDKPERHPKTKYVAGWAGLKRRKALQARRQVAQQPTAPTQVRFSPS